MDKENFKSKVLLRQKVTYRAFREIFSSYGIVQNTYDPITHMFAALSTKHKKYPPKGGGGLHQTNRSTLKILSGLTKALTNCLTYRALSDIHLCGHVITYTIDNLTFCYSCNRSFITGPTPEVV